MVSDRNTNSIAADRELLELVAKLNESKIRERTGNQGVNWFFNPPLAPHFGGVHEIMIKVAKKADEELMLLLLVQNLFQL